MVKYIKYVEITVDKGTTVETGLFHYYNVAPCILRLVLDNINSIGIYNLQLALITNIRIVDMNKVITDKLFNSTTDSQNLAKELLCEIVLTLKNENKLNSSNFVNISAYKDVPDKYVSNKTQALITQPMLPTTFVPKIGFLATLPKYATTFVDHKKICTIFRKSELPTKKALSSMLKKTNSVLQGTYKLKVATLDEQSNTSIVDNNDVEDPYDFYGNNMDGY